MVTGIPDLNVFEYFFQFIKNSMAIILPSSAYELGNYSELNLVSNYIVLFLVLLFSQFRRKDDSNLFVFWGNKSTLIHPHLP